MAKNFKQLRAKFGKVTGFPSDPRNDPFRKSPSGTENYDTGSFFIEQVATGSFSAGLSGIGISLALAIAGAPLMALGTIATNSKRQTALIALQTWSNAPID